MADKGGSSSIVIERTPSSIRFRATSNDVKATTTYCTREDGVCLLLSDALRQSKVFQDAFKPAGGTDKKNDYMHWYGEENAVVSATIIQSSGSAGYRCGLISAITEAINRHHCLFSRLRLQSCGARNSPQADDAPVLHVASSGLISAIMEAYNEHHCLVLRPDDIWQAILTQFSFYVNAHAEVLRDRFVDFDGKMTLVIAMEGNLFSANFAEFAARMVDEKIATNLKDSEVTEWLLPKFSTTTNNDRVAASVSIMSTLQSYFEFVCHFICGIPEVTLQGTPEDWIKLRQKIDRLPRYDLEGQEQQKSGLMSKWHALLAPVLDEFVQAANGHPSLEFWDKVCSHIGGGSGPTYLSGWATVFGVFSGKGEWQGDVPDKPPPTGIFYLPGASRPKAEWPFLDTADLPVGAVSVPVLVDDNGTQYDTQMLAGQFAYEMSRGRGNNDAIRSTLRPRTDWCIAYDGKKKAVPRNYKDGEIRMEKK